ncbi:hypothetical protein JXL19_02625 [bacterium]|nr:hypothetical protein [bacterium]
MNIDRMRSEKEDILEMIGKKTDSQKESAIKRIKSLLFERLLEGLC